MAKAEGGWKWLKYGCLGCLGVLVLGIVIAAVFLGAAAYGVRSETVEEQTLTPEIPQSMVAPPSTAGADTVVQDLPSGAVGQVVLDLRVGEFSVEPAPAGGTLRVEGRYDPETCTLEEELEEGAGETGWRYRVKFRCSSGTLMQGLRQLLGGNTPQVRVYLPSDVPLDLDLRMAQGDAKVELGGMWIDAARLDYEMGSMRLEVSSPLRVPMERLEIRGSMGELIGLSVGNASPRRLSLEFSMGGMNLDLGGAWAADSEIDLGFRMGGGVVRLPEGVIIEGAPTDRVSALAEPEVALPTLRFDVNAEQGDLQFLD